MLFRSEINLYVHRKPIAVFKATANTAGTVTVTNYANSYDPDHQGETNNGIIARQWRWRNTNSPTWTNSSNPPTSLPKGQDYIIALRVRDKDGLNGIGVWSDWTEVKVSTGTVAPLNALFTLNPSIVSHSKTITATNLSTGPISKYEWIIKNSSGAKIGATITSSVPTSTQLKVGGIGKYTLQLRVGDATRWSEPYELPYEIINYPPEAKFNSPDVAYRDDVINLINETPIKDKDGDDVSFEWQIKKPGSYNYTKLGTTRNLSLKIQNLINDNKITANESISYEWDIKLIATDTLGAKSEYTRALEVINHLPVANISGSTSVKQYTRVGYYSDSDDKDMDDNPLSVYRWRLIKPDGTFEMWDTEDIDIYFDTYGKHTIEHYVFDQIGDKSNIATLEVDVIENSPPSMTMIEPSLVKTKPTVVLNNPKIKWLYTDAENDAQEKYMFDYYYYDINGIEDDIYIGSPVFNDHIGNTYDGDNYSHEIPNNTFERFKYIKIIGKTYSKHKWSKPSNPVYFIINDPPTGDFNYNKDPAEYVRGEEIIVTGFGDDPNLENGDSISFNYELKKLGASTWTPISSKKDFTHIINTLTTGQAKDTYQIRQVITDSLGLTAPEVIKSFTINNNKPLVNIIEPESSDKDNPTQMVDIDLKPVIKWEYEDIDNDIQQEYKIIIYNGDTNNEVERFERSSSEVSYKLQNSLQEGRLYSITLQVYDGYQWSDVTKRKYFKVIGIKLSALRITGVYDIAWSELFQNSLTRQPTNYEIVIPTTQITPVSKHPNKPNTPIKIGYKVDFEVDAIGLSDVGDRVETDIEFYDILNNNVSNSLKYINNSQEVTIDDVFKYSKAQKIFDESNKSTWRFSYFLPPTTILANKDELVIKTSIKGIKYSNGYVYNYNIREGWNGKLFQYSLKNSALDDYYIRGGN